MHALRHPPPPVIECVHSDNGGELAGKTFQDLCNERDIRQEFTTPDTPTFLTAWPNGCWDSSKTPRQTLFSKHRASSRKRKCLRVLSGGRRQCLWATEAFNRTATMANPGNKDLFLPSAVVHHASVPATRPLPRTPGHQGRPQKRSHAFLPQTAGATAPHDSVRILSFRPEA